MGNRQLGEFLKELENEVENLKSQLAFTVQAYHCGASSKDARRDYMNHSLSNMRGDNMELKLETEEKLELMSVEKLNEFIYTIRGKQVMLDFELAEIYGYTTKKFNQQVKNNLEKFDNDFRFQLTKDEWENLRSKKLTSSWGGTRYLPYAFTEEGIYMLISVLKGELAIKQHKALVRAFKAMKDYIIQTQEFVTRNEMSILTSQVSILVDKQNLTDVQVANLANSIEMLSQNFITEENLKEWTFLQGQKFEANEAYIRIYSQAKQTIYLFDDYPSVNTLSLLSHKPENVNIVLFTDNKAKKSEKLKKLEVENFNKEYPNLIVKPNNGKAHDRYVLLDYGTDKEIIYHAGASSKDAGNKMCSIGVLHDFPKFHSELSEMLANDDLVLP